MVKKDKNPVCFSLGNSYWEKLNNIAETRGPSRARIIEKAVEEYLQAKNSTNSGETEKKTQICFYPSSEAYTKLKQLANDEGRSVSNLVAFIVKTYIRNGEE